MYPSIVNRFPVIQPVSSKVRHFSTFWLPRVRPWDNRGKCYMDGKKIHAGQTHGSIYSSIFNRLWAIARYWSEIATFFLPLAFNAPVGVYPLNSGKKFGSHKTRIMGLPGSENSLTIGWAVLTQYQRVTDRRTDVQPISITCAVWLTHVKIQRLFN